MRYDWIDGRRPRRYGMEPRYGADYQEGYGADYSAGGNARTWRGYDRDYGPMGSGYDFGYWGERRLNRGHPGYRTFRGEHRHPWGGWSGAYGPGTGLSERQHWYSPWTDPVPGTGMSIPYGMRFGRWL